MFPPLTPKDYVCAVYDAADFRTIHYVRWRSDGITSLCDYKTFGGEIR